MAKIHLYDHHLPTLRPGTYTIEVKQTFAVSPSDSLSLDLPNRKGGNETEEKNLKFKVEGEHYAINQLQINSVFPPAGSMGNFSRVLPHIILNRSTLPWENKAGGEIETTPWLALLLFHEEELSSSEGETDEKDFFAKHIPISKWESASSPSTKEDQVSILVNAKANATTWPDNILPTYEELSLFTHVRSTDGIEKAVIVCKRLPEIGKKNIVHLVSLENCFDTNGQFLEKRIDGQLALVSLKSWAFFCNDHFIISPERIESSTFEETTKEALRKIQGKEYFEEEKMLAAFKEAANQETIDDTLKKGLISTFHIGTLPQILKHLNQQEGSRLRLPTKNQAADQLSAAGFVPIPYHLKTGKEREVVYRGPMIPKAESQPSDFEPIFHADKALRYIRSVDKLDVSYASAWELGKLLAIQNKNFSVALYKWKRSCYQAMKLHRKKSPEAALKLPDPPSLVVDWFNKVKDLKGIPFNYLVPDPKMIPFESIRFFEIDETWLTYFIDGAFSIGRISKIEKAYDQEIKKQERLSFLKTSSTIRSGFLLHSVAVAGWPDLVIFENSGNPPANNGPIGYDWLDLKDKTVHDFGDKWVDLAFGANDTFYYLNKVTGTIEFSNNNFGIDENENTDSYAAYYRYIPSRKEKLSPNLLICLFEEPIRNLAIHQKPESIHFSIQEREEVAKDKTGKSSREMAKQLIENAEVKVVQFKLTS